MRRFFLLHLIALNRAGKIAVSGCCLGLFALRAAGCPKPFFVCLNFFMHFYENIRCLYFAAHKKILRGSARI